jgi:hypothetical protein
MPPEQRPDAVLELSNNDGRNWLVFCLGLGSLFVPPVGIVGVIIGRRIQRRTLLGEIGYRICWFWLALLLAAFLFGFCLFAFHLVR